MKALGGVFTAYCVQESRVLNDFKFVAGCCKIPGYVFMQCKYLFLSLRGLWFR